MLHRLVSACLVLLLSVALMGGGSALAQEGTPAVDGSPIALPGALPVTPDPSQCTVAAPSIDEVLARGGLTPVAGTPGPGEVIEASPAGPHAFALPEGQPADPLTGEAITATLVEVLACVNTGNFLYFFAFVSDTLFAEFVAEGITEEDVSFLQGTPEAIAPEQYGSLVAVREVTLLPDGRVGALVETVFPEEEPGVQVDYFVFVEQDGRWLIDELVEDLEGQYPPQATPTS